MPFPVTYVLDKLAPSETFIRRELEQLRCRNWTIHTRLLNGDVDALSFALSRCPKGFRLRFARAALKRLTEEAARSPVTAGRILKRLPQAADLVRKVADDKSPLIHAHFAGITADLASIAAQTLGVRWTCAVHAQDVFTASAAPLRRRLRTAAGIVACSQLAADAVVAAGISPENVRVIRHGLPLSDFVFHTPRDGNTLFTACRLEEKKGIDTLLLACELLMERDIPFRCLIAGTGPLLIPLKTLCSRLKLDAHVQFAGWQAQEETRAGIANASVLVLPSRRTADGDRDGIANILLEAMALGTPVVTTTAGAAGEAIVDQVNGLLVPPDSPTALANALATVLNDHALPPRLAHAARATVEEHFDGAKNIRPLESFFTQAAELPAAPHPPTPDAQTPEPPPVPPA